MKNLIRGLVISVIMFNGYSSSNTNTENKKTITPKQRTENLKKEFSKGAKDVLKNLQDKKGDGAEVNDSANEYIVCFEKKNIDGKGERFFRIVHPDPAKIKDDTADITENSTIGPIVKGFFEKVKETGEAYLPYEISGQTHYASVIDIGFSDPKTEKGHFICAAVSDKDYEKDSSKITNEDKKNDNTEIKSANDATKSLESIKPEDKKIDKSSISKIEKVDSGKSKEEKKPTENSSEKTDQTQTKDK